MSLLRPPPVAGIVLLLLLLLRCAFPGFSCPCSSKNSNRCSRPDLQAKEESATLSRQFVCCPSAGSPGRGGICGAGPGPDITPAAQAQLLLVVRILLVRIPLLILCCFGEMSILVREPRSENAA
jgi:hypothetical protein